MTTARWFDDAWSALASMPMHVALVDGSGEILAVNQAWRDFASRNGGEPESLSEGVNYLAVCDRARGPGSELARECAEGMRAVLGGRRRSFSQDYPCHAPGKRRWFRSRVAPLLGPDPPRFVVAHADVSARYLVGRGPAGRADRPREGFDIPSMAVGVVELDAEGLRFVPDEDPADRPPGRPVWPDEVRTATDLGLPSELVSAWLEHGRECVREGSSARFAFVDASPSGSRVMTVRLAPVLVTAGERPRLSYIIEERWDWGRDEPGPALPPLEQEASRWRLETLEHLDRAILYGLDRRESRPSPEPESPAEPRGNRDSDPGEPIEGSTTALVPSNRLEATTRSPLEEMADRLSRSLEGLAPASAEDPASPWLTLAYQATVDAWLGALGRFEPEAARRIGVIAEESVRLALSMGLGDEEIVRIRRGVLLRSICRAIVPDDGLGPESGRSLGGPGSIGRRPAAPISPLRTFLRPALDILRFHRERWDGLGARGLGGEQIPLPARLFAVVDRWDELSAEHPDRSPLAGQRIRSGLEAMAGKQLDPEIVGRFLSLLAREAPPGPDEPS
jgi:hypothetical protein